MMSLGDRIKHNYERPARHYFTRRTPLIVRVDGRAFHSWTRGLTKPFDPSLMLAMVESAALVSRDMQGFRLGYVQSDEANFLLTDYDQLTTEAWFGYCQSKVESMSASLMTAHFNGAFAGAARRSPALFDSRAFSLPRAEVANYFLWRARDWERNSLQMYCRAFYSAKQMRGKDKDQQHEMLHQAGKNWATDLTPQEKNGTWILPDRSTRDDIQARFAEIHALVDPMINPKPETST